MKNIFKIAALSIFALSSCVKEADVEPENKVKELHFVISTGETAEVKSYLQNNFDGTYSAQWSKGDELAMFIGDIGENTKPTAILANSNEDGKKAKFEGTLETESEEGTFCSFSPAEAFAKGYANGNAGITLKAEQKPTNLTIDQSCDVLVSKPCDYYAENGEVAIDGLYFKRIFSVLKVNLKGVEELNGETVKSFTITAPSTVTLAGRASVDLSEASISKWNIQESSVTASYSEDAPSFGEDNGLDNAVWLVVNPTNIPSGSKVVFSAETENYYISKTVSLNKDLVFPESKLAVINLTIKEGDYSFVDKKILVEKFSGASVSKKTYEPSETGVTGTGVSPELKYIYEGANTNIRFNGNGHSAENPYLFISKTGDSFTMSKIVVKDESSLRFSCQNSTLSGSATITIEYKESSSDVWTTAGTMSATTSSLESVQSVFFAISPEAATIDVKISVSVGSSVIVDDIVLESHIDNRIALDSPKNLMADFVDGTPNAIEVVWDKVENAGSYVVTATATDGTAISKEVIATEYTFTNLAYETTYTISVYAKPADYNLYKNSAAAVCDEQITTGANSAVEYSITKIDAVNSSFTVKVDGVEVEKAESGKTVSLEAVADSGYKFASWTVTDADGSAVEVTDNTFKMPESDVTVKAEFEETFEITDVINQKFTEITGSSYNDFSNTGISGAVYVGQCAGSNSSVQLRSSNNNSGIVTTKSAGKVTKISIEWNSSTEQERTLDVYGKNSSYISAADLYKSASQGTKLGSIVCGKSSELIIEGDYRYIGLRSNNGAMYLTSIKITWDTEGVIPEPVKLQELSWTNYTKTYTVGETFNVDGDIKAVYTDGSTKTLAVSDVKVDKQPDLSAAGTTTAEISYTDGDVTLSATAEITVLEAELIALDSPKNLMADLANGTPNAIEVVWDKVENAGSYVVTATATDGTAISKEVTATDYIFTDLAYETTYTISVYAKPADYNLYKNSAAAVCDEQITTGAEPIVPGTYEIIPNNAFWGTNYSGSFGIKTNELNISSKQSNITVSMKNNTSTNGFINDTQTRVYTSYEMTFSAPEGYSIKAIAFTSDGTYWAGSHTANVGNLTTNGKNWSGMSNSVTITFKGTCRITKISVTFEEGNLPVKLEELYWTNYTKTYNVGDTFKVDGDIKAIPTEVPRH